jgi:methylenetetrahydrofolate reductase (NADPH)
MDIGAVGAELHATDALQRALAEPRFEVVPIRGVEEQVAHLPRGATVTITCSPAKGIENTLDFSEILLKAGFQVVPHLSARLVRNDTHLGEIVRRLAFLDLHEIFVMGGDAREAVGPYLSALDLLEGLATMGSDIRRIGIAAYPETHPLVDDMTMEQALWEKLRYADYMVTQICFDAQLIARWLAEIRHDGIALPAYIGLPGVVDRKRLLQISLKIGVGDSTRFVAKHKNLVRMLIKPSGYDPTELVTRLADVLRDPALAVAGFHLNTFNQIESTEEWRLSMLAPGLDAEAASLLETGSHRAAEDDLRDVC